MKERFRRFLVEVLAPAVLAGIVAASIAHGEFEAMKAVFGIGVASSFVLSTLGSILRAWLRTQRFGAFVVRCGIVFFIATPLAWVAAPGVVALDTWRAKRYIASELAPHLERTRMSAGRYPAELHLWETAPANAPWLISRFNYGSDGRTYTLWVMDPGVCGRVTSYSSATRKWTETYDPCWY